MQAKINTRQRLAAITIGKMKPVTPFNHERKDQPKDGKTEQFERLGNACFRNSLPICKVENTAEIRSSLFQTESCVVP